MEREFPPPPRAGLQGSSLVGLLAHLQLGPLGPAGHPAAPPSFVEGLGRWLGWKDAIPLSAVLQAPPVLPTTLRPAAGAAMPAAAFAALEREFQRVQKDLARAIEDDKSTVREDGSDFLPFRRRCFSLQQSMDAAIGPLRAQLRAAMARQSPALAQLAALDAVMASALAPREQSQLAQMPALLEKHCTRLRNAAAASTPHRAWLDRFRHDMQQLLLAELNLRLQPAQGLLDTLRSKHQGPEGLHD
jgi:hypothetical protein